MESEKRPERPAWKVLESIHRLLDDRDEHLRELESLILRIATPEGNKVKGKFAKSQDLRRKFAGAIRVQYRRELAQFLGKGDSRCR